MCSIGGKKIAHNQVFLYKTTWYLKSLSAEMKYFTILIIHRFSY